MASSGKSPKKTEPHEQLRTLKEKLAEVTKMLEPLEKLGSLKEKLEGPQKTPDGSDAAGSQAGALYEQAWGHGLTDLWQPLGKDDASKDFIVTSYMYASYKGDAWKDLKAQSRALAAGGQSQTPRLQRVEAIAKQWLRHGKPAPPTRIAQGWVPFRDVVARASEAMKDAVQGETLLEAVLMSLDRAPGERISVFQIRAFTAEELGHMSPELAALGIAADTSFVWIRANPKAGRAPHAMDPSGVVHGDVDVRKTAADSSWSGYQPVSTKDTKQWKSSGSSGWHS